MSGRPGGFARITKLGQRRGDGADMAMLEWVVVVTPAAAPAAPETTAKKA
jgi:large subunit ribosomal protein L17